MALKSRALFFAPMDGITDAIYRQMILTIYPEWDFVMTDFFRVPRQGKVHPQRLLAHLGISVENNPLWKSKTIFQIISGTQDQYATVAQQLADMALPWLDLNLGCPSRLVNNSGAGAALLGRPQELASMLRSLRKNFPYTLSVKMRVGISDHHQLPALINIIQGEGVDVIFLHARTKVQLYSGQANWEHLKLAVDVAQIPIVGNGDLWDHNALARMYQVANCYGAMLGRAALRTPWFPQMIEETNRIGQIQNYFHHLQLLLAEAGEREIKILQRFKALSRYLFDDVTKYSLLRVHRLEIFKNLLATLGENSA